MRWFRENWRTPAILLAIFAVALYLRAYFPWELALPGGLLSGGSDAFYYNRIIEYILETGRQLVFDPLLNAPTGLTNPRPPLYAWTVVVAGKAAAPLFGSVEEAVKVSFLASTAVWGALTVFPLYFLTKEAFGRRPALLAAFFLAVLPAHLQRSPATNGDHDAMVLFFVVLGFFFFLKSLKTLNERRWVEDWSFWTAKGRASIRAGLRSFFGENRTPMLYAMLSGWSLATIALTWQGWAYAPIILLVYFLFQMLVHRFRSRDPMGILIMFAITMGLALLVAFPWYWSMGQIKVWYDVPMYLYLAALALGIVFTVTRDYPWALVVPLTIGVSGAALLVLSFFYPAISAAFVSGAGYFVRTKAFETIAEAQPPILSQIILSFGVATYFLSLFGLVWMAYGITKRTTPDYLFVVVWAIAAIFMAQSAARFIFNASAAFAMVSAWITVLVIDSVRFEEVWKTFRSLGGSRLSAIRRSVKPRHVIGSLLIVFILILPNVWSAVDASIPFERKAEFDQQVYDALPGFLRPQGYTEQSAGGGAFFFGAFGYSLPLEREYYPSAWRWLRGQDADVHPAEKRPAYLSWWDYGFEAVDLGDHPTVADNFLDGYHLAGNFITAQSEAEAVALLNLRLLEGDFRKNGDRFSDSVRAALAERDVPWATIEDAFRHPESVVPVVTADPARYGQYQNLQPLNAQYIFGGEELMSRLDTEGLASLNHVLRRLVGASIRYFAVDARLFPTSGQNTGIFYAPAKLSDQRILELRDGRSIPRDFFEIIAVTQRGNMPLQDISPTDTISDLLIEYKEMFYDSMFYRAYAGYSPTVAGLDCTDCVPGLQSRTNQQVANLPPMQAWNLTRFKMVYRTAYYNPFPSDQIQNHTDAWRAIDFFEGIDLQGKINRGEATGVVDLSGGSAIRQGVVFVKYYDGAFVNGTVTLDGKPWPGVRITAQDELGVPHHTTVTGADGRYSSIVPFGEVNLIASVGARNNLTLAGATTLREIELNVSDAAAMRENVDADGDGVLDWLLTRDIEVDGETLEGVVFVDADHDTVLDPGESVLGGADVTLTIPSFPLTRTARTTADGRFRVESLYPGEYLTTVTWEGRTLELRNTTITQPQPPQDLPVHGTTLEGTVFDSALRPVGGAAVAVRDVANGTVRHATASDDGFFAFPGLLSGSFDLSASAGVQHSLPERAVIAGSLLSATHNVTVYPSATVSLRTTLGGATQSFVTVTFEQRSSARLVRIATTDATGSATVRLPAGTWDAHARHFSGSEVWASIGSLTVAAGESASFTAALVPGARVGGLVFDAGNRSSIQGGAEIVFRASGGQQRARADLTGQYLVYLPIGPVSVQVSLRDLFFNGDRTIAGATSLDLPLTPGVLVRGIVVREYVGNASVDIEDPLPDARIRFSEGGRSFQTLTAGDGVYEIALPTQGRFSLSIERDGFVPFSAPAATSFDWVTRSRFSLLARDITVAGAVRLGGAPFADPDLPVTFRGLSPGAVDARAILDGAGRYTVAVQPGAYEIHVDRAASPQGDVRLQLQGDPRLTAPVGSAPLARDLSLTFRSQIDGTVDLAGQPRSATLVFEGADTVEANATDGLFSVFLSNGTYSVTGNLTEGLDTFLVLQTVTVSGPGAVSVTFARATNVTGTVTRLGAPIPAVTLTFARQGGGTVRSVSDTFGQYHAFLLGGTYGVSADHPATTPFGAGVRHVRYTFSGSVTVVQDTRLQVYAVDLDERLDNATVSGTVRLAGTPVPARLTFLVRGANGINATATAGPDGAYLLEMQPGSYDVYAIGALDRAAFLGALELAPGPSRTYDVALQEGVRLTGTTLRGATRVPATLTITTASGRTVLASDAAGSYQVVLPRATYTVEATTSGTERGVAVTYRATESLELEDQTVLNLNLEKVVRYAVDASWDAVQRRTIAAGATVDYTVAIRNTGNADDVLVLSASASGFSFQFSRERVPLPFGTGNETTVRVTITAGADARVDHAPISLIVRSEGDVAAVKTVVLELDILRFRGLDADVASQAPTWDGRFLNYTIEVRNPGNGADEYRLTLPNLDELRAAGWAAALVGPDSDVGPSLEVTVEANATLAMTLRLEKFGGVAGSLARVQVVNAADPRLEDLVTVTIQLPSLAAEGSVQATGLGVTTQAPGIDVATAAFLLSLAAVVAAAAYLALLRRRSR